jgi:hypothetical protein
MASRVPVNLFIEMEPLMPRWIEPFLSSILPSPYSFCSVKSESVITLFITGLRFASEVSLKKDIKNSWQIELKSSIYE